MSYCIHPLARQFYQDLVLSPRCWSDELTSRSLKHHSVYIHTALLKFLDLDKKCMRDTSVCAAREPHPAQAESDEATVAVTYETMTQCSTN